MTKRRLVCTCVFGVLGAFLATDHAQAQSIDAATRHARPQTTAQALWVRGFGPGLVSYGEALKSSDPKVRGLAAMKIVEDKQNPAIATVESALQTEKDDHAAVVIAAALASIGADSGVQRLLSICSESETPAVALSSIAYLNMLHLSAGPCVPSVLRIMQASDAPDIAVATSEVPGLLGSMSGVQKTQANQRLTELLSSSDAQVRLSAADSLVRSRVSAARPAIETAARRENDPDLRRALQRSAEQLQTQVK